MNYTLLTILLCCGVAVTVAKSVKCPESVAECAVVECEDGDLVTPEGKCCPECVPRTVPCDPSSTSPMTPTSITCPALDCDIGEAFPPGQQCPECATQVTRPDCGGVTCPPLDCPLGGDGTFLPEYCCPVCVSTNLPEPENCTEPCDSLSCTYGVYRPALSCCNACIPGPENPPANCETVTCPFVDCVGGIPDTSPGECCVLCAMP